MGVRWSRMSWSEKNELWKLGSRGETVSEIAHGLQRAQSVVYAAVGQGHHTAREVLAAVFPQTKVRKRLESVLPSLRPRGRAARPATKDGAVPLKGLIPGMAVHFAHCCHFTLLK